MGCKIIFAPQAIADLEEAVRHIARHEPETALRIGNALIDRVAILENRPLARHTRNAPACASWPPHPTSSSIAPSLRKAAWKFCAIGTVRAASQNWANSEPKSEFGHRSLNSPWPAACGPFFPESFRGCIPN